MAVIRKAEQSDISRIAEILVFTKRVNYRPIFRDDKAIFGALQVLPVAEGYLSHPERLETLWVYEDEFVKGLVGVENGEITKLFVEPFFQGQGIGEKLLTFAVQEKGGKFLWAFERNDNALKFYQKHGFSVTQERKQAEDREEYAVKLVRWEEKEQ